MAYLFRFCRDCSSSSCPIPSKNVIGIRRHVRKNARTNLCLIMSHSEPPTHVPAETTAKPTTKLIDTPCAALLAATRNTRLSRPSTVGIDQATHAKSTGSLDGASVFMRENAMYPAEPAGYSGRCGIFWSHQPQKAQSDQTVACDRLPFIQVYVTCETRQPTAARPGQRGVLRAACRGRGLPPSRAPRASCAGSAGWR